MKAQTADSEISIEPGLLGGGWRRERRGNRGLLIADISASVRLSVEIQWQDGQPSDASI